MSKFKLIIKNLGPGLLFASMAIGTSHLVLSTKAGAQYGCFMVLPIVLANILKYPFLNLVSDTPMLLEKVSLKGTKTEEKHICGYMPL